MSRKASFAVIGGDKRNLALAGKIKALGFDIKLFGFGGIETPLAQCGTLEEAVGGAEFVIGPTPCSLGGSALNAPYHNAPVYMEGLFRLMLAGQVFIAGFVRQEVKQLAADYAIEIVDMLEQEELLVLNAIPTAEGAIKIAIEETDITLHGSRSMVVGYGRIGTVLAGMLKGMGAKVSVVVNTAHAAALAKSAALDVICYSGMDGRLSEPQIIFNTVPEIIFNSRNLPYIDKNALIIDLASAPMGVDAGAAREAGIRVLYAGSLPGKVAPSTTADYIFATIERIISERKGDVKC